VTTNDNSLGQILRTWRDRLQPADVGLPDSRQRRSHGLRREDLAALAGVSVDYVVRLEQGRARNPSMQVVAALARSLQLNRTEHDHLYRLAGLLPPASRTISSHVPPGVQRLVARLGELPLAIYSADWTLLYWTALWALLLGDPLHRPTTERNLVRATFLGEGKAATRATPWPVHSERGSDALEAALVADLRLASANYSDDTQLASLIAELREASSRFATLWTKGAAAVHATDRKTIQHPAVGNVTVDCDVLLVPGGDVKIVAYSADAGSVDIQRLDLLRVTGTYAFIERGG
jgi:transcriptional regulator with XRE-family HTH domain